MKVLGVIPARYGSSRFPGKPLIDLKGKSMIQRVYEGAQKATLLHTLVVATDDQRIFDEVRRFGGEVVMTSTTHQSGTDRCAEVLRHFPDHDTVINIQGDEPLVSGLQLDELLGAFRDPAVQIATLVHAEVSAEDLQNVNRIKVIEDLQHNAIYFSRSALPNMHYAKNSVFPPCVLNMCILSSKNLIVAGEFFSSPSSKVLFKVSFSLVNTLFFESYNTE